MLLLIAISLNVGITPDASATENKRPLSHQDFDGWRSLSTTPVLSRDGRWLAYTFMPLEGDGDLIVRELASGREQRVPVGALPPPPLTASEENPDRPSPRREVTINFTSDNRFVVATTFPTQAETLQAKRSKKSATEMPKEGLVAIDLRSDGIVRIPAVKNSQIPAQGGSWIAYSIEPEKGTDTSASKPDGKLGSDLVLRDLAAPTPDGERVFSYVLDYWLARDGRTLVFTVAAPTETDNGIFAVTTGDPAPPIALAAGSKKYARFTWDRDQTQAAFIADKTAPDSSSNSFSLYHWKRYSTDAVEAVSTGTSGMADGFGINGEVAPIFSQDGKKLFVPTAPLPKAPDKRCESLIEEERVIADLWHWRDNFVPTFQRQRADKERKRAYYGVFDLASRRYVQLADLTLPGVTLNDDGTRAFGLDDRPYRRRIDYDGFYQDLYVVDATTGARQFLIAELGEKSGVRWSHNGRWIAFYRDKRWHAADAQTGVIKDLTASLPISFADELADFPGEIPSYGTAGWTRDGDSLLLYDRYDVWQVHPDGRPARCLTSHFGRENKIILRVQSIEPTEPGDGKRGLDETLPLVLRGESEITRASGFFRMSFASAKPPERLLWEDKNIRYLGRALEAEVLLLSASRFDEFPDLHVSDSDFASSKKVSDGGSQLKPFLWGSAELLTYRNADGVELPATLYKPADFDPSKKYPMIVYIYERLSQIVHTFTSPAPSAVINIPYYTSNGYLVLTPDITYTTGYPGQSALKCVLPAVDEIVRRGFVDEKTIGIQGHSWGGYQAAYLITQTNRFRAAEAGAVVSNMTSAYSGIRMGSGRVRQFQYEHSQSRIGQPLQEAPLLYLENSPVFHAQRVQTPLLLLHNDQDDAVPWAQGLEFFLALRRFGKEAYLINYNNEFHGLRRRADQKDFARRMSQFFDHFLKGKPKPDWMENGIPFTDREDEKLRFREAP